MSIAEAREPSQIYYTAYRLLIENPGLALATSTLFVVISQIKINVTNAYAGSLAWSNFFSRATHAHPGRVVWVFFNIAIAIVLMELGVFDGLQKVLGLYSNVAMAWIAVISADLTVNRLLKLRPPQIEFRRANLHDFNPVGYLSMLLASLLSILAFTGLFGALYQAYSWALALGIGFICPPILAYTTKGRYYLNRDFKEPETAAGHTTDCHCEICDFSYDRKDTVFCPYFDSAVCSLCCTLETNCHEQCKPKTASYHQSAVERLIAAVFKNSLEPASIQRCARLIWIMLLTAFLTAIVFWLVYANSRAGHWPADFATAFDNTFLLLYALVMVMFSLGAWWYVLSDHSRMLAEEELTAQNTNLEMEIAERLKIETELLQHKTQLAQLVEQKTAELDLSLARLNAESTRLRTFLQNASDGIHILDMDGNVMAFSDSFALMLGYENEEAGRLNVRDWDALIPQEQLTGKIRQLIAEPKAFETRHRRKDGSVFDVEVNAKSIVLDGRNYLYASSRDITERKLAEDKLAQSETFSNLIVDTVPEVILVVDADGRITRANTQLEKIFGYQQAELAGQPVEKLIPTRFRAHHAGLRQSYANENLPRMMGQNRELSGLHKDGYEIAIEVGLAPLKIGENRFVIVSIADIRLRNAALQSLRESEMRFRLLTETIKDYAIIMLSTDGYILTWNEGARRLSGFESEESIGRFMNCFYTVDAIAAGKPYALLERAKRSGTAEDEGWRVRKDGTRFYADVVISALHDTSGALIGFAKIIRDITERKRNEEALKESRNRLEAAASAGIVGVWEWNLDTNELFWDSVMCKLYGINEDNFAGAYQAWENAVHPDDLQRAKEDLNNAITGNGDYTPEFRVIWPDGSIHFIKAIAKTSFDAGGKALRMVGVNYDITAHKQLENALRSSLKDNEAILNSRVAGFWVTTQDRAIKWVNWTAAQGLGYQPMELIGQSTRICYADDASYLEFGALRRKAFSDNQDFHSQCQWRHKDDSLRWFNITAVPLPSEPSSSIWVSVDINDAKLAENQLIEAKKAAEIANQAKSAFLAAMSHEIRTPMNAIIGLSGLGLELPELTPKLQDYLAKIYKSSKALLSIINDILDYSKVESGRLELETAEFNIEDLLDNVADLFTAHAEDNGLELVLDIDPQIPPHLLGDSLRLGQVMINLVGNALKFTASGEIHVKAALVELPAEYADEHVRLQFSVRDTGIGMSQEQQERLFVAFSQADGSISRRFGGSGLGLAICKHLVEKMGGELTVSSEPNRGSCFSFTLDFPVSDKSHFETYPSELRGMRVLVVDDLETSRLSLTAWLRSWKFEITEVGNGAEALEQLKLVAYDPERCIEMVLLDWKMPEMDGLTAARRIRDLESRGDLPKLKVVMMITAHDRDQLLQQAHDIHLDAVLSKPVNASRLFDAIIKIQGGHSNEKSVLHNLDLYELALPIQGARVLLVEDNEINQIVARELLQRMGLHVSIAENGEQALACLQQTAYDIALMDLQMPVMDGLETSRHIRKQARYNDLPIIAMTAAVLARDREDCEAAGMNDHISKPIEPKVLLNVLLKWIKPRIADNVIPSPALTLESDGAYPEIHGVDSRTALARMVGNRALFHSLLAKASDEYAGTLTEIRASLADKTYQHTAFLLHKLRGVLGNIAVNDAIMELVDKAESTAKAGSTGELAELLEQLEAEMHRLAASIRSYLAGLSHEVANKPQSVPDSTSMAALLTELRTQSVGALDLFEELYAGIAADQGQAFALLLRSHIEALQFAQAIELLSSIDLQQENP